MTLLTEPVAKQPRQATDTHTATQWLDALSTGTCDQDAFLRGVGEILRRAPDTGWELLALLDQYYRRGKIGAEAFGSLKSHLQGLLMGKARGESSTPMPLAEDERPAATTAMPRATPASGLFAVPAPALATSTVEVSVPFSAPSGEMSMPVMGSAPIAGRARVPVSEPLGPPAAARIRVPFSEPVIPAARTRVAASEPVVAPTPDTLDREVADAVRQGSERSLAVGDVLRGRYRVQGLLGQGGMGTVFEAIDQYRLDRSNGDQKVAIKVLHTAVIQRPRLFAELRREFQHLQSLSHPNIVRVHEFDRDGDTAFFTMEYLSGTLLTQVLSAHESSPLERPYALGVARDVAAAVAHAHARGVVHGDLNPGNIFITDNGEVRVLDFGAAHQLRRGPWISEFENQQQITVATTSYASCQLLEGETAEVRDDVYALACVVYVLLTGNLPFGEHTALKARTLRLAPKRPRALNRRQWDALRSGLHFARERRPSDLSAWIDRLDFRAAPAHLPVLAKLLTRHPQRRSGAGSVVAGGVIALILACVWWSTTHVDFLASTGATLVARLKSTFGNSVISQLWDNHEENGSVVPPIDVSAVPPATVDAAPEPPVPASHQSAPVKTTSATRNAPHASAGAAPLIGAAAVAPTVAANGAPGRNDYPIHARLELAADTVDVEPTESMAHVIVRRSRTLRGDVTFNWWTESGTAKPGQDFEPVKSQIAQIENGKNEADLMIPILPDPARHEPRSFYVVIDEASENAALGARTLTMVTIPGTD